MAPRASSLPGRVCTVPSALDWSYLVLPSFVVILWLPAVVAVLLRARLMGTGNDPGAGGPIPAEAEKRRSGVMRLLCLLTIVVAVVQVAVGYALAQNAQGMSGGGGIGDELRRVYLAIAIGPALILGTLLIAALQRRRADRVYALATWGNITLVLVGVVEFYVVEIVRA